MALIDTDDLAAYDKEYIQPYISRVIPKTFSFSQATDAEITTMLLMHKAGLIDLTELWAVGESRPVKLSAMAASSLGERHAAQNAELVILHGPDCFDLSDDEGGGKNLFVIGLKDELATDGEINSTGTNVGGWESFARRAWCDDIFKAALPAEVQKWFKKFKYKASDGNKLTTSTEMENYFTLASRSEVFGGSNTSYTPTSEDTTQFDYYKTTANRVKKRGISGSAYNWWLRSPYVSNTTHFCFVNSSGSLYHNGAIGTNGLAPFGCV